MARRLMSLGQLREFPVNLDIAKTPDGLFTATLTLPLTVFVGLGDPVPASSVQPQLPAVRIEWQMFHAGFAGRLDHGRLTGTLRLGNTAVPVTFARGVSQWYCHVLELYLFIFQRGRLTVLSYFENLRLKPQAYATPALRL